MVILAVSDFSKLTGDYPSLSAVDIKVLALTYLLEKEHVGTDHLCKTPKNIQVTQARLQRVYSLLFFYSILCNLKHVWDINASLCVLLPRLGARNWGTKRRSCLAGILRLFGCK